MQDYAGRLLSEVRHGRDERLAVEYLADSVAIAVGMVRRAGAPAQTN